jgi:hypothetical protein
MMNGPGHKTDFNRRFEEFESRLRQKIGEVDDMVRDGLRRIVPADTAQHLSNSKREFLMAIRTVIDRELERTPAKENSTSETQQPAAGETAGCSEQGGR